MQITASFADATEEAFDRMVDVHLKGVFFLTQKLLPLLVDNGSIVNVNLRQHDRSLATATDFSNGVLRDKQQLQEIITSVTALGRYGTAVDIAGAIAALLGDRKRWITGQRIEVSGGVHL